MLEHAKKYEDALKQLFFDIAFDPFYQFQNYAVSREVFELPKDTCYEHHFVSMYNGTILGLITYGIRHPENMVSYLHIVRFAGPGGFVPV